MEIPLQADYSPADPDGGNDMFKWADEVARDHDAPADDGGGFSLEGEFPQSERQILDDDFLNMYGRDPEEYI